MGNRKNVWSNFQKFWSTFIQPFIASPMPDIPELFISSSAPVFNWLEVGRWARAMHSYDDAAQCFVERVVHCKCEEEKQHEFLSFEISSPTGSYRATVFVDRRVNVTQGVKQKAAVMSPSPSQTISNSEIPLANDVVWVAAKGGDSETSLNNQFGNYLTLRTLTFPHDNNRPSAQHLATLLQTTSMHERHYKLYGHQCYWFAHTVFESLQKLHPTSLLSYGRYHKKRSQYRGSDFPKADSVDEVCTEFQTAWGNFLDRKEEHQREQIAEREIVSVCPIALASIECILTAGGEWEGGGPSRTGGIGEQVGS
jgi:hypothetical protein